MLDEVGNIGIIGLKYINSISQVGGKNDEKTVKSTLYSGAI